MSYYRNSAAIERRATLPAEGSVYNVANRQNMKVEEVIAKAEAVVLCDISGSMADHVAGGRTRWDFANEALESLQRKFDGKILLVEFHSFPRTVFDGHISRPTGGTNMTAALEHVKDFDGSGMKFIVISDGCPDDEVSALAVARTFTDPIDVVFIGSDHETAGRDFLRRMASGQFLDKTDVKQLEARVAGLLGQGA